MDSFDEKLKTKWTVDLDYTIYILKCVCVAYGLTAIGCTGCGIMTLWYASSKLVFPFATASGVWTGIFTFVICVGGLRTMKRVDIQYPQSTKCGVLTFYMCIIINLTFSILHVSFSSLGFSYCASEFRTGERYCNEDERSRLMLLEGFNIAFGICIFLLSLATTVYTSMGKKIQLLTGIISAELMT